MNIRCYLLGHTGDIRWGPDTVLIGIGNASIPNGHPYCKRGCAPGDKPVVPLAHVIANKEDWFDTRSLYFRMNVEIKRLFRRLGKRPR